MSRRSTQAIRLARELSEATRVNVEIRHEAGAEWWIEWGGGPTLDQMRDRVTAALARWPEMRDRRLRYHRGWGPRAWAARAIAARRDGSLARQIAAEAPHHQRAIETSHLLSQSDLTAEDFAVLRYVEQLIDETPYPGLASDPADEPLIEQLLAAAGPTRGEYQMVRVLTASARAPEPADGPPTLRVLRGCA